MKNKGVTLIVMLGLCLALTQTTLAGRQQNRFRFDAERIVDRTLEQQVKQTDQFCRRLEFRTDKCVDWISGLLLIGDEVQASQLAQDAVSWINQAGQWRIDQINRQSQFMVIWLQRFGLEDLADEVTEAANQAVLEIQYAAEDSVQAILDLLNWNNDPGEYAE